MLTQFSVTDTAPCVQGHFPGMPVVPGAFLLAKLHECLLQRYPGWALIELKKVKFLMPLLPGANAQISVDDNAWPRVKLRISCADQRLLEASGTMFASGSSAAGASTEGEPLG